MSSPLENKIEEHQLLLDEMLKGEGLVHVDLKLPVTPAFIMSELVSRLPQWEIDNLSTAVWYLDSLDMLA